MTDKAPETSVRCGTCWYQHSGFCRVRGERVEDDDACSAWQSGPHKTNADKWKALWAAVDAGKPGQAR